MKNYFLRHVRTNAVLIVLLCMAIAILMCSKYVIPSEPVTSKPVVYYLSDELHFAAITDAIEQEHKTGKVVIDKPTLRSVFPVPKHLGAGNFTGMSFIVPGESGLSDPGTYFATPPLNRRDENIVGVWNIAPWNK